MSKESPNDQKMLEDLLAICRKNLPKVNKDLITKAFNFALEPHKHAPRPSGEPYFYHPYEVAMIVVEEFPLDDITVVSTLLHDVVEDTDFDLNLMTKEFGKEVTEIVDGVTK